MIGFEPISSRPYAGRTSNCASKSIFLQERPSRDNHNGITLDSLSVFRAPSKNRTLSYGVGIHLATLACDAFVGYRLTYDVDIITHLRYYYQRFFCIPSRIRAHIFKSVAWCSIRWTIETIWGWELLCVVRTVYGSFFFSPRIVFPFSPGTTHFTSIEFFGCTSKFYVLCICEKIVLFCNKHPHPNTLEIQTLTKLLGNLLNKSPCSVSFCLCLHS